MPIQVNKLHDKWAPVTTAWRVLRLRMEERPPIWRVAANISNKQLRTADKGSIPASGLGEVLASPFLKISRCYERFHKASDLPFGVKQVVSVMGRLKIETGGAHVWMRQMNLGVVSNTWRFVISWELVGTSWRTLIYGVSYINYFLTLILLTRRKW